jgi:hypothetical protein
VRPVRILDGVPGEARPGAQQILAGRPLHVGQRADQGVVESLLRPDLRNQREEPLELPQA